MQGSHLPGFIQVDLDGELLQRKFLHTKKHVVPDVEQTLDADHDDGPTDLILHDDVSQYFRKKNAEREDISPLKLKMSQSSQADLRKRRKLSLAAVETSTAGMINQGASDDEK